MLTTRVLTHVVGNGGLTSRKSTASKKRNYLSLVGMMTLDADMHTEVQSLIEQTMPANEHCQVEEYLNDDLPVCMETDSDSWEADFLQQLGQEEQQVSDQEASNEMVSRLRRSSNSAVFPFALSRFSLAVQWPRQLARRRLCRQQLLRAPDVRRRLSPLLHSFTAFLSGLLVCCSFCVQLHFRACRHWGGCQHLSPLFPWLRLLVHPRRSRPRRRRQLRWRLLWCRGVQTQRWRGPLCSVPCRATRPRS